jgi:hypothetical protein
MEAPGVRFVYPGVAAVLPAPSTVESVNVQPYILQQGLEARHAELVRQAEAGRLAASVARRRRLSTARLRAWLSRSSAARRARRALEPQV